MSYLKCLVTVLASVFLCSFNTEVSFSATAPHIHKRIELTKKRCELDIITSVSQTLIV